MKVKRSELEHLIKVVNPDIDTSLLLKKNLLGVLRHEILHLLLRGKLGAFAPIPDHIRNRMPELGIRNPTR
jgi:hypothetical protein